MRKLDIIKNYYGQKLQENLPDFQTLGWESQKAQFDRFRILTDNIELNNHKILDVGCGLGNLLEHLKEVHETPDYTDVDILEENNVLFLTGVSYNGESFLMPLEDLNTSSYHYMATLRQLPQSGSYQCLFPIPEKWLSLFPEEDYRYESLEEDAEYIYKREKLAEYPGRKLSKKRNLVNQFLREYTPEIREINTNSQEETLHLLQLWQCRSGQEMGDSDYQACIDGLQLYRDLNLSGALYLANRKPCGFILGEYSGASLPGH